MIKTDYLVVGAGASAMAFVDTLLHQTDATVTIVDKRAAPGGHWNDAYPYVRLHQPSSYYGVASRPLGAGRIDTTGLNEGFEELATSSEILAYFQGLMERDFLPSGRVTFYPKTEYTETGSLRNLLSGQEETISVQARLVDATICENTIPLTHRRKFNVEDGVHCIPPNHVPQTARSGQDIVVLGAGKTAMDTVVWLLNNGMAADYVAWVVPRDPWMINRAFAQPSGAFFTENYGGMANMLEAFRDASDAADFALRMEAAGLWMRLDPNITPEIMHGPTIAPKELALLRSVSRIHRLGRVQSLSTSAMTLERGTVQVSENTVFVDCTASALSHHDTWPVFSKDRIAIQMIRLFQPCFSAAMIAKLTSLDLDDKARNKLATPLPMTDSVQSWISAQLGSMMNQAAWGQVPELKDWIKTCRLDGFGRAAREVDRTRSDVQTTFERMQAASLPAMSRMQFLMNT